MVQKAEQKDEQSLKKFLLKDPVYNTFLLSDLETYGFQQEFQKIYFEKDQNSEYQVVYLTFYNNLILAGDPKYLDAGFVRSLKEQGITVVMGRAELVEQVSKILNIPILPSQKKHLYCKEKCMEHEEVDSKIQIASLDDVDKLYDFLMSIDELKNMYQAKEMIVQRIANHEGTHVFIEENGAVIAHANTTAKTEKTVMIGGIGVHPKKRHQGLASNVVAFLAEQSNKEGRIPCLFSQYPEEQSFLKKIGFHEIGFWGALELQ